MSTRDEFAALVVDDILPSRMPDVGLLREYLARGCPHGDPICFSFGETWNQAPAELLSHLDTTQLRAQGYQLSMYGLPALRQAMSGYVGTSQRIDDVGRQGRDFEVAATWTGTRSAMFDFGRYLLDRAPAGAGKPVVLAAGPSWDYEGVFSALGYTTRYHNLDPKLAFEPDPALFAALVDQVNANPDERLALIVINAQHNPTAVNWSPRFVTELISHAVAGDAGLLLDDAYFAVHDPGVQPTSSLRLLLEQLDDAPESAAHQWLAVRSMGKQFHCNGWGIGALIANPAVLDPLVNRYRLHNSLMYGGMHQQAMARWLTDPASERFLATKRVEYAAKRKQVDQEFRARLGYPHGVHTGQCSSYLMFELPAAYAALADGCQRFRDDCLARAGVLFAPAWPWPYAAAAAPLPYMRMFIGPSAETIAEAVERLRSVGVHYDMDL